MVGAPGCAARELVIYILHYCVFDIVHTIAYPQKKTVHEVSSVPIDRWMYVVNLRLLSVSVDWHQMPAYLLGLITTPLDLLDGIACLDDVCFCKHLVFKALREVA